MDEEEEPSIKSSDLFPISEPGNIIVNPDIYYCFLHEHPCPPVCRRVRLMTWLYGWWYRLKYWLCGGGY